MLQEPEKKKKINPLLMKVIVISVALHVIAGVIAGFVTFVNYIIDDTRFEEPPPVEEVEPPPEVNVEIQPEQPKEQFEQKLTMPSASDIAINALDLDLPNMDQNFTVSGVVTGVGGLARGNMELGLSTANLFGIKTSAERFLVVIDANRRMVSDDKGGLSSYNAIKDEVANLVERFLVGTLFNVAFYDKGHVLFFKPKLIAADPNTKQELIDWIQPINSDPITVGLGSYKSTKPIKITKLPKEPVHKTLPNIQWDGNQVGYVTQLALEQNADAIFIITGYHRGFEELRRPMNEKEAADWQRVTNSPAYKKKLAKHTAEIPEMRERIRKTLAEINEGRAQKGQPPRILKDPSNIYKSSEELDLDWKNPHPGDAPSFVIKPSEIEDYFEEVIEECYLPSQQPSVNVVLFLAGNEKFTEEWEDQLDDYVSFFNGKSRIIRGADEINEARSKKP